MLKTPSQSNSFLIFSDVMSCLLYFSGRLYDLDRPCFAALEWHSTTTMKKTKILRQSHRARKRVEARTHMMTTVLFR